MAEDNDYRSEYSEFQRAQKMFGFKNQDSLDFTPYFRYEIGAATHPYHLSFPEKPTRIRYQNDIINYLCYFGSVEEAIECLEYHYDHFDDKEKFLRYFKFSLPARIQFSSKKDDKIMLQVCLDWVIDVYESYKMEPVYIGARTDIEATDPQKVMALIKYLFSEVKNQKASETAIATSQLGIAIVLSQFTCFKSYEISTLARKASSNELIKLIPDNLRKAMQAYFFN